jgi:DNA modification methylase
MRGMDEASVDAVVTDPPYELGFMSKAWDRTGVAYQPETWREALRVLKPGGHLLAFGGTRTYHRLACAIEDAGFEIRDCLVWMYGSGFPKSLDVSKAIDKAAGAQREVIGTDEARLARLRNQLDGSVSTGEQWEHGPRDVSITAPATPEAARWQGWGTALKPAHEPIVLARKPLTGTVAANVQAHGTGALNIEACRVEGQPRATGTVNPHAESGVNGIYGSDTRTDRQQRYDDNLPAGRWPANVALDPEAAAMLDEQSGDRANRLTKPWGFGGRDTTGHEEFGYGDSGGASRFFYCAKASRAERNAGLEGLPEIRKGSNFGNDGPRPHTAADYEYEASTRNSHPTVKPISLMRWLCRLVTPPGGTVLDPFAGSGTTGCAAVLEGFDFIGCEREAEYVAIAEARIAWWAEHRGREADEVLADSRRAEAKREKHEGAGQLGLL